MGLTLLLFRPRDGKKPFGQVDGSQLQVRPLVAASTQTRPSKHACASIGYPHNWLKAGGGQARKLTHLPPEAARCATVRSKLTFLPRLETEEEEEEDEEGFLGGGSMFFFLVRGSSSPELSWHMSMRAGLVGWCFSTSATSEGARLATTSCWPRKRDKSETAEHAS